MMADLSTSVFGTNCENKLAQNQVANFRAAAKTAAALFLSGIREPDAPEHGEKTLMGTLRDGPRPHEG
jgi:hypothetical protein